MKYRKKQIQLGKQINEKKKKMMRAIWSDNCSLSFGRQNKLIFPISVIITSLALSHQSQKRNKKSNSENWEKNKQQEQKQWS